MPTPVPTNPADPEAAALELIERLPGQVLESPQFPQLLPEVLLHTDALTTAPDYGSVRPSSPVKASGVSSPGASPPDRCRRRRRCERRPSPHPRGG
jgi:hypothetical protein